jgi:hypothetical protein
MNFVRCLIAKKSFAEWTSERTVVAAPTSCDVVTGHQLKEFHLLDFLLLECCLLPRDMTDSNGQSRKTAAMVSTCENEFIGRMSVIRGSQVHRSEPHSRAI